jgi:hypothetical protein
MKFVRDSGDSYNPTECAYILADVKSASCNAATWFLGLEPKNALFTSFRMWAHPCKDLLEYLHIVLATFMKNCLGLELDLSSASSGCLTKCTFYIHQDVDTPGRHPLGNIYSWDS